MAQNAQTGPQTTGQLSSLTTSELDDFIADLAYRDEPETLFALIEEKRSRN